MRFAAVQLDIVWEDKPANHAIIESLLTNNVPGTFIVLPELGDTGFSMNLDRIVDDRSLDWASGLAKRLGVYVQHGFAKREVRPGGSAGGTTASGSPEGRNCAAIIAPDGKVLCDYQKIHPFSYGKESQFYSGGNHLALARCADALVCPLICYDLRFPELWRLAALAGAEVFTIGASWPAARQNQWRSLLIARAIENQAYVVAVNRTGRDPHLPYAGGSMIVSHKGEILAEADDQSTVLQADLDLNALRQWRAEFPALRDVRPGLLGSIPTHIAGA